MVTLSLSLEWQNEIINFSLALILVSSETFNFFNHLKKVGSKDFVKVKSDDWFSGLILVAFMIYWFADEPMNFWNLSAIIGVIIYGILVALRDYRSGYLITGEGILNLKDNKLLSKSDIKSIDFKSEEINIHSSRYKNDLTIRSSKLISPNWDELTLKLSKLTRKDEG